MFEQGHIHSSAYDDSLTETAACLLLTEKHSDSKTTASLILEKENFLADYLYNSTKPTRISNIFHSNRPVTCSSPVILLGALSPDFTAFPFGAVFVFSRMGVL